MLNALTVKTLKLSIFFQNEILFSHFVPYKCEYFCMKLAKYNEYLLSTVDTDALVL